jgi:hypothetical protein
MGLRKQCGTYWVVEVVLSLCGRTTVGFVVGRSAHFVPDISVALLVKFDDFHDGQWVFLLFQTRDTTLLKELLPFLGQACELAGRGVKAHVGKVDGIVRSADLWALGGIEEV